MPSYIQTNDGISVYVDGDLKSIHRDSLAYPQVVAAIQRDASAEEIKSIIASDLEKVADAVEALKDQRITDDVAIDGGAVTFKGTPIDNTLTARMLRQLREGFDLKPMARFLENLMQNPSYRAVHDLYSFLEYGKMPITEDGCFLAYKKVRADYRDIRTGTIDNSVGQVVSMPRNRVNEDPEQTCSFGLHVCSFDYLPHYASAADDRVMITKVNPRDVVAIPKDYHDTKMRVSCYEVVGELERYQVERRNRLTEHEIATKEAAFELRIGGVGGSYREAHESLRAAAERAEELLEDEEIEYVEVVNTATGVQVERYPNPAFVGYEDDGEEGDEDDPEYPYTDDPVPTVEQVPASQYRVYLGGDGPECINGTFAGLDMALKYGAILHAEHEDQPIFVKIEGKTIAVIGG